MPNTSDHLVVQAARGQRTQRTPVWLMRQAGRADPEYRRLRERCGLLLEDLFRTPELAAEITLLPRRLGVDALILFQDILTPLAPMGAELVYRPAPILANPAPAADVAARLRDIEPADELAFVAESIRLVRQEVAGALPLLGFAGAPLTVAAFLLEGGSPGRLTNTRTMLREQPQRLHELLKRLARMTSAYLRVQVEAGVDGIQLFESVADLLSDAEYRELAHPYQARVLGDLDGTVPRILFVKERPCVDLMVETGADVLSVGACVDLAEAKGIYGDKVAFQGNINNRLLVDGTPDEIRRAVEDCVLAGGHAGHILNLSHGLLPDTPIENVQRLIETCRLTHVDTEPVHPQGA